jgi:glycine betaine/choline ABC-type transport system substrate-binding protein
MRQLNHGVDGDHRSVGEVAEEFLQHSVPRQTNR